MHVSRGLLASLAVLIGVTPWLAAPAADLFWNGVGSSGSAGGGSGTWDTTSTTWETAATGGVPAAWTQGDNGFFGGSAGTVTLGGPITANGLTFSTAGYTITGDTLTLGGTMPTITASQSATIASGLTGSAGLVKAGAATLTLTAASTYTGITSVTGGTLEFAGGSLAGGGEFRIGNGAAGTLTLSSGTGTIASTGAIQVGNGAGGAGTLNVNAGTLSSVGDVNVATNGGSASTITVAGGALTVGNRLIIGDANVAGNVVTLSSGSITATNSVVFGGGGAGGVTTSTFNLNGGTLSSGPGGLGGNITRASTAGTYTFNFNGGTLRNTAASSSLLAFSGTGAGNITYNVQSGGAIFDTSQADATASATLVAASGNGGLTKNGGNTLTLTGIASGNAMNMTVAGGTLRLARSGLAFNNTGGVGNGGSITVGSGATLDLGDRYNLGSSQAVIVNGGTLTTTTGNGGDGANYTLNLSFNGGGSVTGNAIRWGELGDATITVNGTTAATISSGIAMIATGSRTGTIDVVNAAGQLTINTRGISDLTAGGVAMTKAGAGTLTMAVQNGFTAPLTINAGTVAVDVGSNSANPTGTGLGNMTLANRTVTVNSGGTLRFDAFDAIGSFNYASPTTILADGGTITQRTTANTFLSLGNVTLRNGGRITTYQGNSGATQAFALNGTVTVSGTSGSFIDTVGTTNNGLHLGTATGTTTFDVGVTGAATDLAVSAPLLDRAVSGTAVLLKIGAGTMRTTVANSYSGGTTLRAGAMVTSNGAGFGVGAITINDGSTGTASNALRIDASAGDVTVGNAITVANQGTGTTTLGSATTSGTSAAAFTGAVTLARSVTLDGGAAGGRLDFAGGISGTGNVTVVGTTRVIFRSAANTYAGSTTVNGILQLSDGAVTTTSLLPDDQTLTVATGGVLRLSKGTNSETIGGLSGGGEVSNIVAGVTSTLIMGGGNGSGTFSGVLSNPAGTLAIQKTGSGAQVLSGVNSFTGATSVTGGILRIGSTGSINATSGITVNGAGAELRYDSATPLTQPLTLTQGKLSGSGSIGTALVVGSGAVISPGNSPGTLTASAGSTWNTAGTYEFELNALSGTAGTQWDLLNVSSGGLNLASLSTTNTFNLALVTLDATNAPGQLAVPYDPAATYELRLASYDSLSVPGGFSNAAGSDLTGLFDFDLTGWQGPQPTLSDVSVRVNATGDGLNLVVVPEPGSLAAAAAGLLAVVACQRARRRTRGR